jgi:hypothetical protein
MLSGRNERRWLEEEWRRKNEREVEKVEKMEEHVVEVGAVKEVGLRAPALSGELDKIFCEDKRVKNDGNSGA